LGVVKRIGVVGWIGQHLSCHRRAEGPSFPSETAATSALPLGIYVGPVFRRWVLFLTLYIISGRVIASRNSRIYNSRCIIAEG